MNDICCQNYKLKQFHLNFEILSYKRMLEYYFILVYDILVVIFNDSFIVCARLYARTDMHKHTFMNICFEKSRLKSTGFFGEGLLDRLNKNGYLIAIFLPIVGYLQ